MTGGTPLFTGDSVQGGGTAGAAGVMSYEFPETAILGGIVLYGFLGAEARADGLHLRPRVPEAQPFIRAENILYHGSLFSFEATQDTLAMLREHKGIKGVMHCFSGSAETAEVCVGMGLCVSFTGSVTFKNARKVVEAAAAVPLERLMAETDCPYLSPEPVRGRRNDPSNVRYVLGKLAEIKGVPADEMAEINIRNARELFGIE